MNSIRDLKLKWAFLGLLICLLTAVGACGGEGDGGTSGGGGGENTPDMKVITQYFSDLGKSYHEAFNYISDCDDYVNRKFPELSCNGGGSVSIQHKNVECAGNLIHPPTVVLTYYDCVDNNYGLTLHGSVTLIGPIGEFDFNKNISPITVSHTESSITINGDEFSSDIDIEFTDSDEALCSNKIRYISSNWVYDCDVKSDCSDCVNFK